MNPKRSRYPSSLPTFIAVLLFSLSTGGCGGNAPRTAVIETELGSIKFELLTEEAPVTVENFRQLADRGLYTGTIFHRVISGFMIQGGDPKGDGTGGETASGQPLPNETHPASALYMGGYKRGMVAMANSGSPESGRSQFFIMHGDRSPQQLRPDYTIFGRVTEGMEVVDQIASGPKTGRNDRPLKPVTITRVTVQ
jgi:cyclophilin family peptidyl-prolyl cis-trans isomerase